MADVSLDMMTMFSALNSDPAKAKVLEEIRVELQKVADAKAALREQHEKLEEMSESAARDKKQAQDLMADVAQREAKLSADTEALSSAIKSLNEEKHRWEKIRQHVDLEHNQRQAMLEQREREADSRQQIINEQCADLIARRREVVEREAKLADKHAALKAAIDA